MGLCRIVKNNLIVAIAMLTPTLVVHAQEPNITELHFQQGNLKKIFQGGGSAADTNGTAIATAQHASGWKYGDNFFFFDAINYGKTDADAALGSQRDYETYGELYVNFSLGKITGEDLSVGFIRDFGLLAGFNYTSEIDTLYYLPGVRLALDIPGFAFANLDVTAYIQDNSNKFGVVENDSYMVDFNWAYPFTLGNTKWSLEGHIEYIDSSSQSIAGTTVGKRESWVFAQPQLRLDIGNFWGTPDKVFAGIEYQYWHNKLGDPNTTDNTAQILLVWRF